MGSKVQDQVLHLLDEFQNLKEKLDRGIGIQTLETVDAVHERVDVVHKTVDTVHGTVNAVHEVQLTNGKCDTCNLDSCLIFR